MRKPGELIPEMFHTKQSKWFSVKLWLKSRFHFLQVIWYWFKPYRWESREKKFTRIYQENVWGNEHSLSGAGSDLTATERVRGELPSLLQKYGITSMLDIPCGDFFWMKEVDLTGVNYIGADIVQALVDDVSTKYATSRKRFVKLDLAGDPLPKVDLVLCRDCLFHLSFGDTFAALRNIKRSGSKYLLTTTFTEHRENVDIITGHWRPINLTVAPYNLPAPLLVINEACSEYDGACSDKSLGLWLIANLPD